MRAWERYLELDPGQLRRLRPAGHALPRARAIRQGRRRAQEGARPAARTRPAPTRRSATSTRRRSRPTRPSSTTARRSSWIRPTCACGCSLGDVLFSAPGASRRRSRRPTPSWPPIAKNRYGLELKGRALRELQDFDGAQRGGRAGALARIRTDLQAAFLKVTIAEARRDFADAAEGLEALLARNRTGEDPARASATTASSWSTSGSPTSSSAGTATRPTPSRAAAAVGGEPDAALLGQHVEALLQAKDLDKALSRGARGARALPGRHRPRRPRGHVLREKGDTRRPRSSHRRGAAQEAPPKDPRCSPQSARLLPARQAVQGGAERRCARRARSSPRNLRVALPARRRARAPEAPRRGGGGLPRGARASSPTRRPCSTTSAT